MKLFKRLGSLENIFKPKRKRSPSPSGSLDESLSIDSRSSIDVTSSGVFRQSRSRQKKSSNKRLSRSVEIGRRDSSRSNDIRDFRRKKSSASEIILSDISDIRYCGYLQYKSFLKWQTLWCVVCKGCFYGFRSQSSNETVRLSVILTHCQISYVSEEEKRQKKLYVFRITQPSGKNMYLNAYDHSDLCCWLQVLQMEANKVQREDEPNFPDRRSVSEHSFDSLLSSTSESSSHVTEPSSFDSVESNGAIRFDNLRNLPHVRTDRPDYTDWDTSSTDDLDNGSTGNACSLDSSFSRESSPRHDLTLKHLWQKDNGYLLNVIRTKLGRSRRRKTSGESSERRLVRPRSEECLVVEDDSHRPTERHNTNQVRRTSI